MAKNRTIGNVVVAELVRQTQVAATTRADLERAEGALRQIIIDAGMAYSEAQRESDPKKVLAMLEKISGTAVAIVGKDGE